MKSEIIFLFTLFEKWKVNWFLISLFSRSESEIEKPRDRDREVKYEKNSREFSRNETLAGYCHRPYRPCPNFSVPASVKAKSSLVYNVFHQIGKIRTSGILRKGYEFWQGLKAELILESISESCRKYFIKTFVWLFPVATHVQTQMDCFIQKSYIWIPALLKSHKCIPWA